MAKLYSNKTPKTQKMMPKEETISFLLNYSKALTVLESKNNKFEIIAN